MFFKYNIFQLFRIYKENQNIINAYINGESIEGFKDTINSTTSPIPIDSSEVAKDIVDIIFTPFLWIFGISVAEALEEALFVFIIYFIFSIISFIISLIFLIKNWRRIPTWAKVLGIIFLFSPLPIVTTLIVTLI